MTNEVLDALARRANDAGFPTIPEYALALEKALERVDDRWVEIYRLTADDPRSWARFEEVGS